MTEILPQAATPQQHLEGIDRDRIAGILDASMSDNTRRAYRTGWASWLEFALERCYPALPAETEHVVAWLAEIADRGCKYATLRTRAAAVSFVHRARGAANPCDGQVFRSAMRGLGVTIGTRQEQKEPMGADELAAIEGAGACDLDVAIIRTMRDAMLRRGEAAALEWGDVEEAPGGTGRLMVRRSKTDRTGKGAVQFLSVDTMEALKRIKPEGASGSDSVFGLSDGRIAARVKRAAAAAGLDGSRFGGHSMRIGMAQDLLATGATTGQIAQAGRWQSEAMVARYTENQRADRSAVRDFYGEEA